MRPQLIKFTPGYDIKPFDCEDADLNGFLLETDSSIPNAHHHALELLAVYKKYQGQQWGRQILAFLKERFTNDNKTGCRYITVDALKTAQGFYESYWLLLKKMMKQD